MARERGRIPCAAGSLARHEPIMATASRVRRWLLVEQPGPWGREALLESRLDDTIARALRSRARRANTRVVLIRRPGWSPSEGTRVYLVRSDPRTRWVREFPLSEPGSALDIDLQLLAESHPPTAGVSGPVSLHLICTNGRHDPCCADLGRPVVRSLQDDGVSDVWECSHIGGDRFAANMVFLPTGVYYGRVPPEEAARLVAQHDAGMLDLEYYRGRSCYQPLTQAAEILVRRELNERGIDALRLTSTQKVDDDTSAALFARGEDDVVEITVRRHAGEPEHLTCSESGAGHPWRYDLIDLQRR